MDILCCIETVSRDKTFTNNFKDFFVPKRQGALQFHTSYLTLDTQQGLVKMSQNVAWHMTGDMWYATHDTLGLVSGKFFGPMTFWRFRGRKKTSKIN